jgi:hypothetical protein
MGQNRRGPPRCDNTEAAQPTALGTVNQGIPWCRPVVSVLGAVRKQTLARNATVFNGYPEDRGGPQWVTFESVSCGYTKRLFG